MKILCSITIGLITWLTVATAFAESAAYTFVTVDIPIPGHPGFTATPEDINDQGAMVTNIFFAGSEVLIVDPVKQKSTKVQTTTFRCVDLPYADTYTQSINDNGEIAGYCLTAPTAPNTQLGFIRYRNGKHILLDFPGADGTGAFGINDYGQVVGQYYNPLIPGLSGLYRFHGFIWDNGTFTTIDFPKANTYTMLWSINKRGQILGEYYTFNPATNETLVAPR